MDEARTMERVRIGRFVVLAKIGAGATNTVFAAYDPQLDRKVALKVLAPTASTDATERRDREARALARLRHPHVVAIHEIGNHHGDRFIAMDLVDGVTLRAWLESSRSWRQVLDVLTQAGSALVAAHAAGIVHGELTPENVLVEHGQARIVGFGLSQAGDAAADQYAYCVTLSESLFGPTTRGRVPSWLRRAVMRGLAPDPAQRWPSMAALLDSLARGRRRPITIAAAALGGALAGAVVVSASSHRTDRCAPEATRLDAIWNEATIAEIETAFAATELAYAADSWARAHDVLARWAEGWAQQQREACVATYEHGEQSEAMFDARMQCLDRRLDELESLTAVLAHPDATIVTRAVIASTELGSLDACADKDELARERPGTTAPPELFAALARARTDLRTGHYAEALPDARALAATADAEGFADLAPAAHLLCAGLEDQLSQVEAAIVSARTAVERADVAGDDRLRAEAEILLVGLHTRTHVLERAFDWGRLAHGTLVRVGEPIDLRAKLAGYEGFAQHAAGRFDEALALRREALALREASGDELDPELAAAHLNLSFTLFAMGQLAAAREHIAVTLDIRTRALGELHPGVARAHYEMGGVLLHLGDTDEAARELQLAIDIATRALGPNDAVVGRAYVELANVHARTDDPESTAPYYEHGIAILERALGPDDPEVGSALGSYGALLARMPMPKPLHAIEVLTRARAMQAAALGPDFPELAYVDNHLTAAYLAAGQLDAASAAADSALRVATASFGATHGLVALGWLSIGNVAVARHDMHAAARAYETALAVFEGSESLPSERAVAQFVLAKVLAESGERDRAVTLARAAQQGLVADGSQGADTLREVTDWLTAHE